MHNHAEMSQYEILNSFTVLCLRGHQGTNCNFSRIGLVMYELVNPKSESSRVSCMCLKRWV